MGTETPPRSAEAVIACLVMVAALVWKLCSGFLVQFVKEKLGILVLTWHNPAVRWSNAVRRAAAEEGENRYMFSLHNFAPIFSMSELVACWHQNLSTRGQEDGSGDMADGNGNDDALPHLEPNSMAVAVGAARVMLWEGVAI